jgi:heat shock protein HtpX
MFERVAAIESERELAAKKAEHVRIFKAGDYMREAVHIGAAAALVSAVGVWVGPMILAGCAAGAGLLVVGGSKISDKLLPKILKRRDVSLDDAEGLSEAVEEFTPKMRLAQKPALHDFEIDEEELKRHSDVTANPAQLQRVFNAAASGISRPVIIVSEALLQGLEKEETRAVVAHEFAHLGGRHIQSGMLANWLQMTTMFAAMFGLGGVVVGEGWLLGAVSIGGSMAIAWGGSKMMPRKEERYTKEGTLKPGAMRRQMAVWGLQEALSVGILAIPNPMAVLTAVAIEHGYFWAANFINKSLSRRHEFQADRGAVEMGGNPLKLITSLRKLEATLQATDPALALSRDWRRGPWYTRPVKLVETLFKTHPDTQRRCNRLAAMAEKQGYSADEIREALTAPIDVAALQARVTGRMNESDRKKAAQKHGEETEAKYQLLKKVYADSTRKKTDDELRAMAEESICYLDESREELRKAKEELAKAKAEQEATRSRFYWEKKALAALFRIAQQKATGKKPPAVEATAEEKKIEELKEAVSAAKEKTNVAIESLRTPARERLEETENTYGRLKDAYARNGIGKTDDDLRRMAEETMIAVDKAKEDLTAAKADLRRAEKKLGYSLFSVQIKADAAAKAGKPPAEKTADMLMLEELDKKVRGGYRAIIDAGSLHMPVEPELEARKRTSDPKARAKAAADRIEADCERRASGVLVKPSAEEKARIDEIVARAEARINRKKPQGPA